MRQKIKLFVCVLLLLVASCRKKTVPNESADVKTQTGMASFYADKFIGRPTASGEKYDAKKLTAAHKTLPFGTIVQVTNLRNNKTVTVRINDRGPFVAGRIIDLSKAAAEAIDMVKMGVVSVKIQYK
ncbi:MAG: septal ring lytic transglycosylase RlpA family protein [Chitinophagaceae bacterium]